MRFWFLLRSTCVLDGIRQGSILEKDSQFTMRTYMLWKSYSAQCWKFLFTTSPGALLWLYVLFCPNMAKPRTKVGDYVFQVLTAWVWNGLLPSVQSAPSLSVSCYTLKSALFTHSFSAVVNWIKYPRTSLLFCTIIINP